MELIKYEGNEVVLAAEFLEEWKAFQTTKKEMEKKEKDVKESLKKFMEENGVMTIKNDYFTASYIPETVSETVDTDKLIASGLFDDFKKTSKRASSLRMKWKQHGKDS